MKGTVTIGRDSRNVVNITVTEEASRQTIVVASLTREQFADALTGLAYTPCELDRIISPGNVNKIGMRKETKVATCFRVNNKPEQRRVVLDCIEAEHPGWELWDDGTSSQQRTPNEHRFVLCRWVEQDTSPQPGER